MNRETTSAANSSGNFASGHLTSSSGVNFFIATSPDGEDLNKVGAGVALDGSDTVIGVGNCYVSDYSVELAVGSLPTVNVTVEGANMNSDTYTGNIASPAVNQTNGTKIDQSVELPDPTRDGGITGTIGAAPITALRPGDVTVNLAGVDGLSLVNLDGDGSAHVQSASISVPLSRSPIDRLGSRFPFAREVDFPVTATMNISAVVADSQAGNLADLLNSTVKQASILIKDTAGANAIEYKMKGLKIDSQSFSSSIGSNKTVDITFSTQIGGPNDELNGVFMSGINGSNKVFIA
jgi:hypothetical protein